MLTLRLVNLFKSDIFFLCFRIRLLCYVFNVQATLELGPNVCLLLLCGLQCVRHFIYQYDSSFYFSAACQRSYFLYRLIWYPQGLLVLIQGLMQFQVDIDTQEEFDPSQDGDMEIPLAVEIQSCWLSQSVVASDQKKVFESVAGFILQSSFSCFSACDLEADSDAMFCISQIMKSYVWLQTTGGLIQQVEQEVAMFCPTICQDVMQKRLGSSKNNAITLPSKVTPAMLSLILDYCRFHQVTGRSNKV